MIWMLITGSLISGVLTYLMTLAHLDAESVHYNTQFDYSLLIFWTFVGLFGIGLFIAIFSTVERNTYQKRIFQFRRLNHREIEKQKRFNRSREQLLKVLRDEDFEDLFSVDMDEFRPVLHEYSILGRLKK